LCKECAKAELNGNLNNNVPNGPLVTPQINQGKFGKKNKNSSAKEDLVTNKSVQLTRDFKAVYSKNKSWFDGDS
jgi:hypothetical protein